MRVGTCRLFTPTWNAVCLGGLLAATLISTGCATKGTQAEASTEGKEGKEGKGGKGGKGGGGAVPVTVAAVVQKDVPVDIQVVGNVEAYSTITVKARVGGELTQVSFNEGDFVKKGDLLFTIDQRPFQAAVNQARASMARDEAQLNQAEANLTRDRAQQKYAESQSERYAKLFKEGVASRDQAEQFRTAADALAGLIKADQAAIESARANIAASKATMETAQIQLNYTKITSPIDGRTGNLLVKQGNIVTANTTDLMTINQVQPVYVTFAVPESQLPSIKRYMTGGAKLPVLVTPQDDTSGPSRGTLTFVDNTVDPTTGTIKLKGTFANEERKLWPGEFVRVTLRLTTQANALVVPNQAVQTGQEGQYVFVVRQDRTVESRNVTTGGRVDQDLVIQKGLEMGETVVTEGHLRLAPGMRVQVRDPRQGGKEKGKRAS